MMRRKDSALPAEKSIKNTEVLLKLISNLVCKYNTRAFLVGGPVRDLIMFGKTALTKQDLDIAVEHHYDRIAEELAKKLNAKIIRYPQFMTATLILRDNDHIDIAQTRKEIYSKPAILPKVNPASIKDDLNRRDFTVNAMALEILSHRRERRGKELFYSANFVTSAVKSLSLTTVIDPFDGRQDIRNKLIRILHPMSFIDDPTRIFRAFRFAARFNFAIEKETAALMKKAVKDNCLKLLSGERVLYEIKMICAEKKASEIFITLQKSGVIKNIFGVNLPTRFFKENKKLTTDKKLIHFFSFIPASQLSKFPLTKEVTENALALKESTRHRRRLAKANKPSEIYRMLRPLPIQALEILAVLEKAPIKRRINLYIKKYARIKIFTTGETLKQLNLAPGKIFSKILNRLLCLKLDGKIKTKVQELKYIQKTTKRYN